MALFVSLYPFREGFPHVTDLLDEKTRAEFIGFLHSPRGKQIQQENGISDDDFTYFVASLQSPETVLFHSWIEQNKLLRLFLTTGSVNEKYVDTHQHLHHSLAEKYRTFVSPFLSERILSLTDLNDFKRLQVVASWVVLLDSEHRPSIEALLFKPVETVLLRLGYLSPSATEEKIVEELQPILSDEVLDVMHALSRASYYLKLEYVERLLAVIKHESCTARVAGWILNALGKLKLNAEHEIKIREIQRDVKSVRRWATQKKSSRRVLSSKGVGVYAVVAIGAMIVFFLAYYQPFSDPEPINFGNETSFTPFTTEERKRIDSLINILNKEREGSDKNAETGGYLFEDGHNNTFRKSFVNRQMEAIFRDLQNAYRLHENGWQDSCSDNLPYVQREGVSDLLNRGGTLQLMVSNESAYDVIVYVSEDRVEGRVFSQLIKQGEHANLALNNNDALLFIPGKNFQRFQCPESVDGQECPSSLYRHHFCEKDDNFAFSLQRGLQVGSNKRTTAKVLLTGNSDAYFDCIDVHEVLVTYE